MAFDFSKLNFFSRLDARARVLVLVGSVIGVIFLVYLGTRLLAGGGDTTGASKVAAAPRGLQTVPGGQQTPEFSKAVEQANLQRAQQAQMTGSSAIPTLMNIAQQGNASCVICADQVPNVKITMDEWVKQGKLSPDIAKLLADLADQNVSIEEYAAQLDALVKAGKVTAAQARELLETYKKQHAGAMLQESAKIMDDMIKAGQVPLSAANELLDMQKNKASSSDYATKLQELVNQGKILPAASQKLLAQYTQQLAKEIVMQSIASLKAMSRAGEITSDVEKQLTDLEMRMVPVELYSSTLDGFVAAGKMTPIVAKKILDEFKYQKSAIGPMGTLDQLLKQAIEAAYAELDDLLKSNKITQEVADQIRSMIQQDVSMQQFKTVIDQWVQQNKLTPEIAKLKVADYALIKGYRDLAQKLSALQGNNASPADYAEALKQAVQAGMLTSEQATQLMQEYQAVLTKLQATPTTVSAVPGGEAFAQLQKRLQAGETAQPVPSITPEFESVQAKGTEESVEDMRQRIEDLQAAMSGQAQQLISSWQPPTMASRAGTEAKATGKEGAAGGSTESTTTTTTTTSAAALIKAGTIQFAVLDTEANSDYPDSPIMATIVDGKYKGAKLLGKLRTVKGVAGQMDRISLEFTLMNMDAWPKSKGVTAYAIDPDTARTVLASHVNYHYLQRFGAIMATSFIQGYANAITTSSSTSTTGIFGTSTTHPELSPSNKLAVGLGQVGQALGNVTQNYVNIPPTVKVDSGVGLGILFMADVS